MILYKRRETKYRFWQECPEETWHASLFGPAVFGFGLLCAVTYYVKIIVIRHVLCNIKEGLAPEAGSNVSASSFTMADFAVFLKKFFASRYCFRVAGKRIGYMLCLFNSRCCGNSLFGYCGA